MLNRMSKNVKCYRKKYHLCISKPASKISLHFVFLFYLFFLFIFADVIAE